jgi:endonuclease G
MELQGYNEGFLGKSSKVPMPKFSPKLKGAVLNEQGLRDNIYLDYLNYTVVMNSTTKQLVFAASNINQNQTQNIKRDMSKNWEIDSRIDINNQLDNRYYKTNDWDRGHMVRRLNNAWGSSFRNALKANNDTFFYTNASFQHKFFNQDEWLKLEEFIRTWKEDSNGKLCVFTGPIHTQFDRMYSRTWHDTVRIPAGFFKIVCYHSAESKKLESRAFVLYQDNEFIGNKKKGSSIIKLKNYQVTIAEIEDITGLDFDQEIAKNNPLFYSGEKVKKGTKINHFPERIPIEKEKDIVKEIHAERFTQEAKDEDKTLIIAAAMVNPEGKNELENEWVSLLNVSKHTVNLKNWRLEDQKANQIDLSEYKEIIAGEALQVAMKNHKSIRLVNTGGTILLFNDKNEVVDREYYTEEDAREQNKAIRF